MKSILYVTPFAFAVSGADESLAAIIKALRDDEFQPHVALPSHSPYRRRFEEAGATMHSVFLLRLKRTTNLFYWFALCLWLPVEVLIFLWIIYRNRISLVHVNMEATLSAAIAARIARIPAVIHYRGKTRDTPKWFFDRFLPFVSRLADHVFVISRATAAGFLDRNLRENVEVLHNAVHLVPFQTPTTKEYFQRHGEPFRGKKIITFLGRMDPQKRLIDLIDAASFIASQRGDVVFAVFGGDPNIAAEVDHRRELEKHLDSKTLRPPLFFLGQEADVPSVLHSSDLFVLPSIDEGFGRVVVEAMATGTPVIAADSGALPELLKEGRYGRLVPPCQSDQLAAAILECLDDPSSKKRAEAARAYATSHFDIEQHVSHLKNRYHALLER